MAAKKVGNEEFCTRLDAAELALRGFHSMQ
jgi:hypothetical protein